MTPLEEIRAALAAATPGPWRWQGEDYRGGWGWQLLVAPDGGGIIVGQGVHGGPCPRLRVGMRVAPELCITGLAARGKDRVEAVHVFEPDAALIAAAPAWLAELVDRVERAEADLARLANDTLVHRSKAMRDQLEARAEAAEAEAATMRAERDLARSEVERLRREMTDHVASLHAVSHAKEES